MSEIHKDIDELLSCYIDGELSDRGRTEVKRLIQHDKNIAAKLGELQKQKQLLNCLPVSGAPKGLLQNINVSLNTKSSADRYFIDTDHLAGARHLLLRRVLTAAAMFVLVGALALVVFSVIMPGTASRQGIAISPVGSSLDRGSATEAVVASAPAIQEAIPDSYPFRAALELTTYDSIAINGFIAKTIYNNGLVDNTIPKRQATSSTYHITCTTDQIVTLVGDLETVWDKCHKTSLTVYGKTADSGIMIDNITSAQTITVFAQDKSNDRIEMAKNFADFNALMRDGGDASSFALSPPKEPAEFVPSVPIKPSLTRPEQPTVPADKVQTGQSVNLIITVTGL
jgi:hypothetical protein